MENGTPPCKIRKNSIPLQGFRSNSSESFVSPRQQVGKLEVFNILQEVKEKVIDRIKIVFEGNKQSNSTINFFHQIERIPVQSLNDEIPIIAKKIKEEIARSPEEKDQLYSLLYYVSKLNRATNLQDFTKIETNYIIKSLKSRRHSSYFNPFQYQSFFDHSSEPKSVQTNICRMCEHIVQPGKMIEHSESCRDAQVERVRIEHLSRKLITMSHKLTKTPSLEVLIRKLSSSYASPNDYRSLSEQILQITESTPEMKELTYLIKEHMEHVSNVITLWEKAKSTLTSPTDEKVPPMISLGVPDFTELRPLARGAFGRVHLVQRKKTGDIFAMKIIPKEELNTKDGMHRILSEREAMTRAMSNYVVPLYFTFQSGNSLFLVMEYSPGGDLFALLQELGSLDEDTARFYGLEIVKALKHLHERGIVHCDIKPDNLLISADGHIKLTDFGLSKVDIIDRALSNESDLFSSLTSSQMIDVDDTPTAKTAPGTPEYLAPEILLGQSFGKEADWWSFGAVMYELVEGVPPFCGDNPAEVFEDVVKGEFTWTVDASDELKDLVAGLLNTDPKKRFGINEVLSHPFFNNVAASNDEPPFQPSLENGADPVYFRQARHSLVGTADRLTDESFLILNKQVQQWNVINYYTLFDLNKKISENSKC